MTGEGRPQAAARRPAVAIVGCGPKGLYAFEAFAAELRERPTAVDIHLFEPHPFPGAGPVYDPRQPDHLRLNFENRAVDAWRPVDRPLAAPDFCAWLERRHPDHANPSGHAPRALVGRYLHECFQQVLRSLPDTVHVEIHRQRVGRIEPADRKTSMLRPSPDNRSRSTICDGPRWRIFVEGDDELASTAPDAGLFDEVLIAVGHAAGPPAIQRTGSDAAGTSRYVPFVFPGVDTPVRGVAHLPAVSATQRAPKKLPQRPGETGPRSLDEIPAGTRVAIRGFALTWIDATLSLFEGRGGRFEPLGQAGQLRYIPSGQEVSCVFPMSRTGHPVLAKPISTVGPVDDRLQDLWKSARHRLTLLGSAMRRQAPAELSDATASASVIHPAVDLIIEELVDVAALAHGAATPSGPSEPIECSRRRLRDWLISRAFGPISRRSARAVIREMELSLRVAHHAAPASGSWALAESWRALYPTLVEIVGHGGLPEAAWPDFRALHAAMERLAFGPPAGNLARILALIEASRIDLSALQDVEVVPGHEGYQLRSHRPSGNAPPRTIEVDWLVDAVIARAGVDLDPSTLLGGLHRRGAISLQPGTDGLRIRHDGRCLDETGHPVPGLSAIGRVTEGCVLGNDTLSRQLHDHPERWARATRNRIERTQVSDVSKQGPIGASFLECLPAALLVT